MTKGYETEGGFEGSAKILRSVFRLVGFGEVLSVANTTTDILIETLPELIHAFYLPPSVYQTTDPGGAAVVDVYFCGPGIIMAPGAAHVAGITVDLYRRRKTGIPGAAQQEVRMAISNATGIDANLAYEVYRITGLT